VDRSRLLESLRTRGISDDVLAAVAAVPRERFVPESLRDRAWEDCALPIGADQTISQPYVVAYMTQVLRPGPSDRVLDVGTGSGYHAAVLARLASHVYSVERHRRLSERAAGALAAVGATNVTLVVGDGSRGLPDHAPFDAINVAAAVDGELPEELLEQLANRGRLLAPVRDGTERLVLVRRSGRRLRSKDLGAVRFVPLVRS
jgi:protein-L-isoaspartate(D-aspartate) O-methyltransferase